MMELAPSLYKKASEIENYSRIEAFLLHAWSSEEYKKKYV